MLPTPKALVSCVAILISKLITKYECEKIEGANIPSIGTHA
jgi:hypothetical protein